MSGLRSGPFALLALALALPGHAHAEAPRERVAVTSIRMIGDELQDPGRREQMRASLAGGLASGFDVVPAAEIERALTSAGALVGCDTTACLQRLGELVKARRVVRGQLEVVGASNWTLWLELVDTGTARVVARVDDLCDVCNVAEASEKLSSAGARLRASAPPPADLPPEKAHTWRWVGIAALIAGAGGLAGGIAALVLDGRESGRRYPGGTLVIQRYDTLALGAGVTAAGAAVLAAGVWALFHDRGAHRVALAPAPLAGGATVFVGGSF